jgi:hypothetical protein
MAHWTRTADLDPRARQRRGQNIALSVAIGGFALAVGASATHKEERREDAPAPVVTPSRDSEER